jgi:tRNA-dihydrouridine synthase B
MIGNDVPSLIRTARELQRYPIAAIDLNLGCPAPIVYRKCAGGGLLREPARVDAILGALRDVVEIKFTVKTRLGFDSPALFESLLEIFARHSLDLLTVHGRTVSEMYRSEVHYDYIRKAVERMPCPVLANGNIYSAERASNVLAETAAAGLMIGRAAIRNPWIFNQIRQHLLGEPLTLPTAQDVLRYIRELYTGTRPANIREEAHVQKMKKYMNFIALGIEPTGEFLHQIRRVRKEQEFFSVCEEFLDHSAHLPLEPFSLKLQAADFLSGEHC